MGQTSSRQCERKVKNRALNATDRNNLIVAVMSVLGPQLRLEVKHAPNGVKTDVVIEAQEP